LRLRFLSVFCVTFPTPPPAFRTPPPALCPTPRAPYRLPHLERGRVWIPGGYVLEARREWVPESVEQVWVEPAYEYRVDECGNQVRVLIQDGHYRTIHRPGYLTTRYVRVWSPGHWSYGHGA
jgi:hypothetical protein